MTEKYKDERPEINFDDRCVIRFGSERVEKYAKGFTM